MSDSVVLPPYFLPPVSWVVAAQQPGVVIGVGGSFAHQTYLHRAVILGSEGPLRVTVPVRHLRDAQGRIAMEAAELAPEAPWARTLWRTLATAYRRSPYWEHYSPELEALLLSPPTRLLELNLALLEWLYRGLGLSLPPRVEAAPTLHWRPGHSPEGFVPRPYAQCFVGGDGGGGSGFVADASGLDLLFCLGPAGVRVLSA